MLCNSRLNLAECAHRQDRAMPCNSAVTEIIHQLAESLGKAIDAKDTYTLAHSEEVAVISQTLALSMGLGHQMADLIHVAGHLHDLGKIGVPDEILSKTSNLTPKEWLAIRKHPDIGADILAPIACLRECGIVDMVRAHHERFDGSGYPQGAAGDRISRFGQMAAIVDVYDALTSDRCYHRGMAPTEALRRIYEWSRFYFSRPLVGVFLRTIGIYPVGSLVRLESGRLAVVTEHDSSNLLTPVVKVIADPKRGRMTPYRLDLSRPLGSGGGDAICGHEDGARLGIDPLEWLVGDPG